MNGSGTVPSHREGGFTLIEVLIAVTITAVIGLGVWQVVSGVVTSRDRVNELADDFDGLQRTMLLLERDMLQMVNRPVRDLYGDFQPALSSRQEDFALLLTRQGWRNPLGIRRSELQRVAWEFTGNELHRRYWPVLDQGQEENSQDVLLLEGVTGFDVRFLSAQREWRPEWPGDEQMAELSPGTPPELSLPLGIEVTLEHDVFGKLVRTFPLPNFDAAAAQGLVNQMNEAASEAGEPENEEQNPSGTDTQGQGG